MTFFVIFSLKQAKNLKESKGFVYDIWRQSFCKKEELMEEEQPTMDQTMPFSELNTSSNTKMETEQTISLSNNILEDTPTRLAMDSKPEEHEKHYNGFRIIEEEPNDASEQNELIENCISSLFSLSRNPPLSNKFQENKSMQKILAASFKVSKQCFHNLVGVTLVVNQKLANSC